MEIGILLAFMSLALSGFFWWNARQQALSAERTLQEIKSQIIGWQNELNRTAIDMLSSRPEMIAKEAALSSAKAEAEFAKSVAGILDNLARSAPSTENTQFVGGLIQLLLKHQETLVLEKQRMGFNAATGQRS